VKALSYAALLTITAWLALASRAFVSRRPA
jgi:hypothetical protein